MDFLHDFDHLFGWKPLVVAGLQHFGANISLFIDVRVVDFGLEFDVWGFEGEVVELELNFKLAAVEWGLLWTSNVDLPKSVTFLDDVETSEISGKVTLSQALIFPF